MADIAQRLQAAEGSARVEFKRSVLWPSEAGPLKVQGVLMRLANANPEVGGLVQLGREDNGKVVGLVNKDLAPVTDPQQIKAAEQKLVQLAQRLDPPMHIRWFEHTMGGQITIVIEIPGRPKGGWYQDEQGVTRTGSASHPVIANQSLLQAWGREGYVSGEPSYSLEVSVNAIGLVLSSSAESSETMQVLRVEILNRGKAASYISDIGFRLDVDGRSELVSMPPITNDPLLKQLNPAPGTPLVPGRKHSYSYKLTEFASGFANYVRAFLRLANVDWSKVILSEIIVSDEIKNTYTAVPSTTTQERVTRAMIEVNAA